MFENLRRELLGKQVVKFEKEIEEIKDQRPLDTIELYRTKRKLKETQMRLQELQSA